MPHVSVIIPAYNAAPFIGEAIASVLAQTHRELDIMVVDDGSTDGTVDVVRRFGARVCLLQQRQGGAAVARNAGASATAGEWLAFLDADDAWLPEKLSHQLAVADAGTGLVYSDRFNMGEADGWPRIHGDLFPILEGDIFLPLLETGNFITTSTVIVRRDVFRAVGGFCIDPALLPAEDWDLWLRIAERHCIRACREPLANYRLHAAGVSTNFARMNGARRRVIARAVDLPRARRLAPETRRRILARMWLTNGWDAGRHGAAATAIAAYLRAIGVRPFQVAAYRELAKTIVRRT